MRHCGLDRAHLQDLGAKRRHFEHFLEGDPVHAASLGHDARVGCIDAIDIRIDIATLAPMAAARATALVSEPPRPKVVMRVVSA